MTARVHGVAGASADAQYRSLLRSYRRVPTRWVLVVGALVTAVVAAGAFSLQADPLLPAAVTAAALVALAVTLRFPSVAATLAVLAVFVPASPLVAYALAVVGDSVGSDLDEGGALISLLVAAALTALLAHRTSRRRPWLTTLLALVAASVAGPLLMLTLGGGGLSAAYLPLALVVAARSHLPRWLWAQVEQAMDVLRRRRAHPPEEIARWARGADGERRTADLLAILPAGYTVLHDLALPGTAANVDHLVIGPSGVTVVDSKAYRGAVVDDPRHGLCHNGRPLGQTLATLLFERDEVAAVLDLAPQAVQALVVVHDAHLPSERTTVGLSDADGAPVGQVEMLSPSALVDRITSGRPEGRQPSASHRPTDGPTDPRDVARMVRRARTRLRPASTAVEPGNRGRRRGDRPAANGGSGAGRAASPSEPVGPAAPERTRGPQRAEGGIGTSSTPPSQPAAPAPEAGPSDQPGAYAGVPAPLFESSTVDHVVVPGQAVALLTDDGVFGGYRVCHLPTRQPNGIVTVDLCTARQWARAQSTGSTPDGVPYPLASVHPEDPSASRAQDPPPHG